MAGKTLSEEIIGNHCGKAVNAGENFGLGSSREHAPMIIKIVGVKAVLARSFARIFYRNCINIGLPAITCNTDEIREGMSLSWTWKRVWYGIRQKDLSLI